ncbi:MAG: dTMP kinase [Deltaproteobacteria bacterium]|nr:MAG: dTMP kinase [Deltaproteobacteria bacterium]
MFISFEGIEGCGKTTQVEHLSKSLLQRGIPHVVTREPGGTRLGKLIRQMLLDPSHEEMEPLTELFLYAADRAQHTVQVIRPALEAGQWVICDRFADATTVYQGYGRGQDLTLIQQLNQWATRGLWPQLSLLLDCPVEIGLDRARSRIVEKRLSGREDRFERQAYAFHQQVREGYLDLAKQNPERIKILDATLEPDRLHELVVNLLEPYLAGEGRQGNNEWVSRRS